MLAGYFGGCDHAAIAPTWASCGKPQTMSPMAKTPGSAVSWASLTLMRPRSSSMWVFSTPMFEVRAGAAYGYQNLFCFLGLRLAVGVGEGDVDARFGLFDLLDFGAGIDVDAALFEEARDLFRKLFVLYWNHAGQELEDGDLCAKGAEERAELHADCARADDNQRLGRLVEGKNFDVGQDAVVRP